MDRRPNADGPLEALRRAIERLVGEAPTGDARINLSTRVNRSVVMNNGQAGSRQAAVSRQTAPVRQDGFDEADVVSSDVRDAGSRRRSRG
jgi:hypothetical protein